MKAQEQQISTSNENSATNVSNVFNRLQQFAAKENSSQNCSPATSSSNNELITSINFTNREQRNLDESGSSIASTSQQSSSSAFIPTAQVGYLNNSTEAAAAVAAVQQAFATNRQTSSDRLLTTAESVLLNIMTFD